MDTSLKINFPIPWSCHGSVCLTHLPKEVGSSNFPVRKSSSLLCRQVQGMVGGIPALFPASGANQQSWAGAETRIPPGQMKGKAWEQAVTPAQLADVWAPGAAQLHCSSHRTSCELTSSQWAELTLEAFSDALAHLEQDSLMLHTKRSQVLTNRWCSAHAPYPEPGVIFKPLQIPTAFSRASLHYKPLKMTNTSHKSLSIKSFTCRNWYPWWYSYQPLSQQPLQMLTLKRNWNI